MTSTVKRVRLSISSEAIFGADGDWGLDWNASVDNYLSRAHQMLKARFPGADVEVWFADRRRVLVYGENDANITHKEWPEVEYIINRLSVDTGWKVKEAGDD